MYAYTTPTSEDEGRPESPLTEPSLDPEDWTEMRAAGHRLWDELVEWLSTVRTRAVWRPVPAEVRERLSRPVPHAAQGLERALADLSRDVLAYPYGNVHPRFWGWVNGSALPSGVLADLAASTMNANVGAFDHAAVLVEEQVLAWFREMLHLPVGDGAGDGILTSGGSAANLYGLAAARTARADFDVRKRGVGAARFTVYGSLETHSSIKRAVELLGIGSDHLRRIPVDRDYRIDVGALERTLAADRAAGFTPLAVVGNAGTVNTGATDDLEALADLCEHEDLWLHVDGAFGVLAWLAEDQRDALRGLQRADSIAFDPHKWLYLSSGVGCILVRDPEALKRTFAFTAPYLVTTDGGIARETGTALKDRGLELTRRFRALKVWIALKEHGVEGFARMIRQNIRHAEHLVRRVQESDELELVAPAPLNVVCFRYFTSALSFEELDRLNRELLVRLQESGAAIPSHTVLGGLFALRVAVTNHRSRFEDFDFLAAEVVRLGDLLLEERRAPSSSSHTQRKRKELSR